MIDSRIVRRVAAFSKRRFSSFFASIVPFTATISIALISNIAARGEDWKYISTEPGDPFDHAPPRAVPLSPKIPEGVTERAKYRGEVRRYGQIRFGGASSRRVAVVVDETGPKRYDLYVDINRNRIIEDRERMTEVDRTWRFPLSVELIDGGQVRQFPRGVEFRIGASGRTLGFASTGYLEGNVEIAGKSLAARRQDGDGDGLLTGLQDRVWIDGDGDGRWNPIDEQFLFSTILTIRQNRFIVRSDLDGLGISLAPLEGTGIAAIVLPTKPSGSKLPLVSIETTLIGRDGSIVALSGDHSEAQVPVGSYRVGNLSLTLADPAGDPTWTYVFSENGRKGAEHWYEVPKDGKVEIDPIGAVTLEFETAENQAEFASKPGEEIRVQPRMYTGDGLLIVTVYRGSTLNPLRNEGPWARVALMTSDGVSLFETRSGFA